jgi:hypothetical protein
MSWYEAHRMAKEARNKWNEQHWVTQRQDGTYNVHGVGTVLVAVQSGESVIARYAIRQ